MVDAQVNAPNEEVWVDDPVIEVQDSLADFLT